METKTFESASLTLSFLLTVGVMVVNHKSLGLAHFIHELYFSLLNTSYAVFYDMNHLNAV